MFAISDTETTGFKKSGALIQSGQARICQIAMLLCDENGNHKTEFSTLIRPDGWEIHEGAYNVHGISMDDCHRYGIPMRSALQIIGDLLNQSHLLVFHNEAFDWGMFQIEHAYYGVPLPTTRRFCTMLSSTDICRLPGKGHGYKWPKLGEALPILCGREIGNDAHDAMVDTKGAKDIFFELMRRGHVSL